RRGAGRVRGVVTAGYGAQADVRARGEDNLVRGIEDGVVRQVRLPLDIGYCGLTEIQEARIDCEGDVVVAQHDHVRHQHLGDHEVRAGGRAQAEDLVRRPVVVLAVRSAGGNETSAL